MGDDGSPPTLQSVSWLSGHSSSSVSTPTATPTAANSDDFSTPTAATATTAVPFTPSANDVAEWEEFCQSANVSSPTKVNTALGEVIKTANFILAGSTLRFKTEDGSSELYKWTSLGALQKAGMAFIINEGILDCFPRVQDENEWIAHAVLAIDMTDESGRVIINGKDMWRHLHQFVRKRGDLIDSAGNWRTSFGGKEYGKFRSDHKKFWKSTWNNKGKWCTTFSLNLHIEPVLRLQSEFSMVCAFVVCSLMIHYRQVIYPQGGATPFGASIAEATPGNQGRNQTPSTFWNSARRMFFGRRGDSNTRGSDTESQPERPPVAAPVNGEGIETKAGNCTLNIGRYMRHTLPAQQKYETIFNGSGFVFEEVMTGLLGMSNASAPRGGYMYLNGIEIFGTSPDALFENVANQLKHGALCARIRHYKGYEGSTMCVKESTHTLVFNNAYHYVAIVGISRTRDDQHGGVMFLAQDSLSLDKTFKNISLELLRDMNSTDLLFYIVNHAEIKMPNGSVFDMKPDDIVTAGGLRPKKSGFSPDMGEISEEERRERKEKRELLEALVNPDYVPEWARGFYGDSNK